MQHLAMLHFHSYWRRMPVLGHSPLCCLVGPTEVPLASVSLPSWPLPSQQPAPHQQQQQLLARKLFACPSCGRGYTCAYTLRRHVRLECGKEAALQCPFCPRRTKHRHSLLRHLRQCHPLPPQSSVQTPGFPCIYKGESI